MSSITTLSLEERRNPFEALIRLPKMSPMTTRLLARLARRDCDVPELTAMVEKDALLSAGLLQLANSAAFARLQPIHSLRHAIAMIGVGTMRKFALAVSVSNLFSRFKAASSFSLTRFNAHSVATGTLTELLAEELPVAFPEEAFLAGMLHDVGKLLIATNLPKQYEDILAVYAIRCAPLVECERDVLSVDHAELSAMAVDRWDLAESIRCAARFHHQPERATSEENVPPGKLGLSLLVHKADAFVNYLGMSILPPHQTPVEAPSLEFEGFRFPVDRVLNRFEWEWKGLSDLFR
jgi:HD-like signal output (HDOD) protein